MTSTTEERRLPENTAQMAHRARKIHQAVLSRVAVPAGGASWRDRIASDPELSTFDERSTDALLQAISAAKEGPAREAILRLAKLPVVRALSKRARRELFTVVADHAALAKIITVAIGEAAFLKLSESVQIAIFGALTHVGARQGIALAVGCAGFAALDMQEQLELVKHLRGPELSSLVAPMRKNRLELVWSLRRGELVELLNRPSMRAAKPALQAEMLRDFLHEPVRSISLLNATEVNGHAVIVFGDPADPRSWCYGRRFVLGAEKRPIAKIYCPDPTVQSGWKRPEVDATVTYASTVLRVSRRTERLLIEWIERAYAIADDLRAQPALGPLSPTAQRGPFVEAVMAAMLRLSTTRGKLDLAQGYSRAGRPIRGELAANGGSAEDACDRALAQYLRA